MKNLVMAACLLCIIGCKTPSKETEDTPKVEATETTAQDMSGVNFPYTHGNNRPWIGYWKEGKAAELALVMNSLHAWSKGNVDESLAGFADSVIWSNNDMDKKVSKDSLKSYFASGWKSFKSVEVKLDDALITTSVDGKETWVTIWYKQYLTYNNNKIDSMAFTDDAKIENGKIVLLDSKQRKLHKRNY